MSSFLTDPTQMNIFNEADLSNILMNCGFENIIDIIENNIDYRFNNNITNLAGTIENVFKIHIANVGEGNPALNSLKEIKEQAYTNIINIICNKFNITFNSEFYTGDLYTVAYILYNFLISNFRDNISNFYTNFIIREKNNIYDILEIARFKKQKNSTTIYNKKTYNNQKLGLIAANLNFVLDNMSTFDLSFNNIIENIFYNDINIAKFILTYFIPNGDFYKDTILPIFNSVYKSTLIIDISHKINQLSIDNTDTSIITSGIQ